MINKPLPNPFSNQHPYHSNKNWNNKTCKTNSQWFAIHSTTNYPYMATQMDAMMACQRLQKIIPLNFTIRLNSFEFPHQDLPNHIGHYIETLVTNVTFKDRYYLLWLSTTVKGSTYEWYASHAPMTLEDMPLSKHPSSANFNPKPINIIH